MEPSNIEAKIPVQDDNQNSNMPIHPSSVDSEGKTTLPADFDDSPDSQFGPAPDGGTRAWLVAAGGSTIFFCCLGFSNAFGELQQYYLTHQLSAESPSDIAWIGSISVFLQFLIGVVGGPLFDRFGAKVCHPSIE
jgi:hypothetical protein